MAITAPKANRSLQRGLALLDLLAQGPALSLADLARAASLPKPTAYRLLRTLAGAGWVYRRQNDGRYVAILAGAAGQQALAAGGRAAQLALPHLAALTTQTGLAADLTWVIEPGILEVIESTRSREAGGVDPEVAGFRPSLAFSAPGRALLAASSEAEKVRHLQHLLRTDSPAERHAATSGQLAAELARTSARGYGIRAEGYWPQSSDYGREPMDIAVALSAGGSVLGCLSLVWPTEDARPEAVARRHLASLKNASRNIISSLRRSGTRVSTAP
jgi:IclR family mhp operon transcriptional activator